MAVILNRFFLLLLLLKCPASGVKPGTLIQAIICKKNNNILHYM